VADLDDALADARRRADEETKAASELREQRRAEDAERAELLADAVRRLEPYGTETFAVIEPASRWRFAAYRDSLGVRYRIRTLRRCWVLGTIHEYVPPELHGAVPFERPILLLDDARVGTFHCVNGIIEPPKNRYLATAPLEPVTEVSFRPWWPVGSLRDHLASVIVGYERGPRWHERFRD
jgi:hypothetical protein